jgi:hypothetical protein
MIPGGARLKLRWILGLIVLTLALALAACGGGDDDEGEDNGGDDGESPAATKTVEAEDTETPEVVDTEEPEKTEEPSSGGGGGSATLSDVPVYPGADKTGDWSGDEVPLPLFSGDVDVEDWEQSGWATYETGDSVDDVSNFYKDKMPDNGWEEEGWFDISFGEGAAWGNFTRDDGDSAAWVFVSGTEDQTEIVIGAAHK